MLKLLSLFDFSGKWSDPFRKKGWDIIQWDIKLCEFMDIMLLNSVEICLEMFGSVDGIISAPPCTHFANSGAQYWKIKDEDSRTWEHAEFVFQILRIVDLFRPTDPEYDLPFFWALENPVGRLPKLIPSLEYFEKVLYFQPCQFAYYTNPTLSEIETLDRVREKDGKNVTEVELDLILKTNAYNKKTGLWGEFNRELIKRPILPVKASSQGTFTQRFGGNTIATKEKRSNTPDGFAAAFCEANHNFRCYLDSYGNFIDGY